MEHFTLLKHVHILLALASGLGFALRGFVRLVLRRELEHRAWKVVPHLLDTLLLVSGATLWVLAGWPLVSWLGLKLTLVVFYILLGMAAFKTPYSGRAVSLYMAALLVFVSIASVALHKPF